MEKRQVVVREAYRALLYRNGALVDVIAEPSELAAV